MAERVLSPAELNRAHLARQLLLERSRLTVPKAVERLGAMQAQAPNSPYVGLWSRLEGFDRPKLTRALEQRRVTRSTLFRITVHLVSAADQPAFARLNHEQWREDFLREGLPYDELVGRVERIAEDGPFTYADLESAMPELGERRHRVRCFVPLVHVPPSGTWGKPRIRLTTAERWLGTQSPPTGGGREAHWSASYLARLRAGNARRPAALLAPPGRAPSTRALDALDGELRRFEDDEGRTLLDVPRAPLPPADTPAPVRFLPKWDAVLLSHKDRSRVLPPEYQRKVINGGDVKETFLVDGFVAGTWRHHRGKIELDPFAPLPVRARRELEAEGRRLAAFLS